MAEKGSEVAKREERQLARRDPFLGVGSPFQMFERFADEMDRIFDDFGLGRGRSSRLSRRGFGQGGEWEAWSPAVEVFHRNNELVVRADLPGLSKDDVKVEVTQDGLTIQGERKQEHEEESEGVYRSERSYGSFYRMIPLPESAMTDQAKARFKDGVLEVTMPAPSDQATGGRRLEIT